MATIIPEPHPLTEKPEDSGYEIGSHSIAEILELAENFTLFPCLTINMITFCDVGEKRPKHYNRFVKKPNPLKL